MPYIGYEHADKATLTQDATTFTPPELDAYRFLTANHSKNTPTLLAYKRGTQPTGGLIPGGHITWIVWEKAPGKSLGHPKSAFVYWDMPADERKLVHEAFLREFPSVNNIPTTVGYPGKANDIIISKIMKMGYFPEKPSPSSLIWDKDTSRLYAADLSYNLGCSTNVST